LSKDMASRVRTLLCLHRKVQKKLIMEWNYFTIFLSQVLTNRRLPAR